MEYDENKRKILRMKDLPAITGLQPSTIYDRIAAGKFPKPFKLTPGGRAAGWFDSTIYSYLAVRAESENSNSNE
ncbi:MAG: AlpA family phage regulatory protein [Paracoccaceae bacterium]